MKQKHVLRIERIHEPDPSGKDCVTFYCINCPKFLHIERSTLHAILLSGDRSLCHKRVENWSTCRGYHKHGNLSLVR